MTAADTDLVAAARRVRERAYAPYSKYLVGAALRTANGTVHIGCNVENRSYGLTICAERAAVCAAVGAGEREFDAIAVVTADGGTPCGACRQVLEEFAPEMRVILAKPEGDPLRATTVRALLPEAFRGDVLESAGEDQ